MQNAEHDRNNSKLLLEEQGPGAKTTGPQSATLAEAPVNPPRTANCGIAAWHELPRRKTVEISDSGKQQHLHSRRRPSSCPYLPLLFLLTTFSTPRLVGSLVEHPFGAPRPSPAPSRPIGSASDGQEGASAGRPCRRRGLRGGGSKHIGPLPGEPSSQSPERSTSLPPPSAPKNLAAMNFDCGFRGFCNRCSITKPILISKCLNVEQGTCQLCLRLFGHTNLIDEPEIFFVAKLTHLYLNPSMAT